MSTTIQKRNWSDAMADAEAFRALFPVDTYHLWEFAGSLRRRRPQVGDVEHVVIPRIGELASDDLFATPRQVNLVFFHLDALLRGGLVAKHVYGDSGFRWGEKLRGADFRGLNHELWMADVENWGSKLAIRTGPAEYSRMLVTQLQWHGYANVDGYVINKRDLVCPACGWRGEQAARTTSPAVGAAQVDPDGRDGGPFYEVCPQCPTPTAVQAQRVSVPEERQYFELAGVAWTEPQDRVIAAGVAAAELVEVD